MNYRLCTDANGELGITLFGHAPVGVSIIESLAKKINVEYNDETPVDLAQTIDRINTCFMNEYVNKNRIHDLYDTQYLNELNDNTLQCINPKTHPFEYLMWNRDIEKNRVPTHNNYSVFFVHGHHHAKHPRNIKHVYNLDYNNNFGKNPNEQSEWYPKLYSNMPILKPTSELRELHLKDIRSRSTFTTMRMSFNEFTHKNPRLWTFLKYVVIPASLAALVVFTGGLAAIGIVAAKLLTILVSTVLISAIGNAINELRKTCCPTTHSTHKSKVDFYRTFHSSKTVAEMQPMTTGKVFGQLQATVSTPPPLEFKVSESGATSTPTVTTAPAPTPADALKLIF